MSQYEVERLKEELIARIDANRISEATEQSSKHILIVSDSWSFLKDGGECSGKEGTGKKTAVV
jgi:hypothetical protein